MEPDEIGAVLLVNQLVKQKFDINVTFFART